MSNTVPGRLQNLRVVMLAIGAWIALTIVWTTFAQQPDNRSPESVSPPSAADTTEVLDESRSPTEDENAADADLPGENVLADGAPPKGLPEPIRAWLRMDFEGHTGLIRSLDLGDDGKTLATAGDDKNVHIWRRTEIGDRGWLHYRTIRWPIQRGPRGRVYSCKLRGDLVAFAGHGAFGGLGEVRIVNTPTGKPIGRALVDKHVQVITSLAWSPGDTPQLAAIDILGHTTLWQQGDAGFWEAKVLAVDDVAELGEEDARALREFRTVTPTTFLGTKHLVIPKFVEMVDDSATWHLQRINLSDGTSTVLDDHLHKTHVQACDATADGSVLVSSDFDSSVVVWRFDAAGNRKATVFSSTVPAIAMDLADNGKRLLLGAADRVQLWNLETPVPTFLSERLLPTAAFDVALDDARNEIVIAQGSRVEILPLQAGVMVNAEPTRLTIPVKPVAGVAFAKNEEAYQIAYSNHIDANGNPIWDGVFDLSECKLIGRGEEIKASDFLPSQRTSKPWQVVPVADDSRAQLLEGEQRRGVLPYEFASHGVPTAWCTLPIGPTGAEEGDEKPETGAVIVGTNGRNDIYAYIPDESDPPKLLRHFRGHSGRVTSLATSVDGKYLVSGSDDSTICVWNLQDMLTAGESTLNLWGADFEVTADRLIAVDVREDGPLYFQGVRGGDQLLSIKFGDAAGNIKTLNEPAAMFEHLLNVPFDQLVVFDFLRFGRPLREFQSFAAWRPLATLFVDDSREWAFWTPAGYYDASFNGHQRFGWQVNRGIDETPDYFRAAQFRKALEAPAVMQRLLAAGSLPLAIRQSVSQVVTPKGQDAIVSQYRNKPRIEVIEPQSGETIREKTLIVRAKITAPEAGGTLVDPRAFVSGVPAVSRRELPRQENDESGAVRYEWNFNLPSDPTLQLEVIAATEAEAVERVLMELDHPGEPARNARLHLLALGANLYPDPQIPSLNFAAKSAKRVTELFRQKAASTYDVVTTDQLLDTDAIRPMWRAFAEQAAEQLRATVSPDDLVIMYLCGHGYRDRRTNQWYFVTTDSRHSDLMNNQYSNCITFSDLAALAKLPCRKLAILDSCHSGAVQPIMRRDDLKSVLRFLQDDVVLTVTAGEGEEEAAEQRFTDKLIEALGGGANKSDAGQGDSIVTLNEMIEYVTREVTDAGEREKMPQHPTASPAYLLRTIHLPLTSVN